MGALLLDNGIWIIGCGLVLLILVVVLLLSYRKPDQGQALIRSGLGGMRVSFSGLLVLPLIQKAEFMDITLIRLLIDLSGKNALMCKGGTLIDVKTAFFVRIKPTDKDVRKVVQTLGIKGASDSQLLYDLFSERFIEALKTIGVQYDFNELSNREFFKERVMSLLNLDSDGYMLDVVAIDDLAKCEQDN